MTTVPPTCGRSDPSTMMTVTLMSNKTQLDQVTLGRDSEEPVAAVVSLGPEAWPGRPGELGPEWLVTDGLGGYAFGPVAGPPARSYHGYLVAALQPPVLRTVLVAGLEERLDDVPLDAAVLAGFRLEGMLPVWTYRLGRSVIEKRVWMTAGANATSVRYELVTGPAPIRLGIVPLVTARDHHATTAHAGNGRPRVALAGRRRASVLLNGPRGPIELAILVETGSIVVEGPDVGRWRRDIRLREETARGQADRTSAFEALRIETTLAQGRPVMLAFSVGEAVPGSFEAAVARQSLLLRAAGAARTSPAIRQLVLAADQFLVRRSIPEPAGGPPIDGRSVIAGYPWFNDWGRDTMIALPGLTLATGRFDEAATILRSFDRFRREGLLPNNFPDRAGEDPGYHTIDATLWFPNAVAAYEDATGDHALVDDLLPGMLDSLEWHIRGDAPGYQLTWMDAKVGDWVVTPRAGKPVEIQGLWYNALRLAAAWLRERERPAEAARWDALADRARASFAARFVSPERRHFADVIDGPDGDDWSLRPNQLLAMSLPHPIVGGESALRALAACRAELLTPLGLRSLAPSDPRYKPAFHGNRRERDAAYHNGAVWTWLVGPYLDAVLRLTGDLDHARAVLEPLATHLSEAGLGTISENAEPEPPFAPRGCVAQAWSVAEVLRLWRRLDGADGTAPLLPTPDGGSRTRPTGS
jgi:glycogen debranching enzyme